MLDGVLDMIGTAALLEQLAEESAELAQAALKMARKLRNENPARIVLLICRRKSRTWNCASAFCPLH
jgi:hypothetical protein